MSVALCIGNNYTHSQNELYGCENDATQWSVFFAKERNIRDVRVLMEATRAEIMGALHDMALNSDAYERVLVTYSGHGSTVPDTNRDEADGYDETICPVDFMTTGMITDDDLSEAFAQFACEIVFISDSCHSGSILDAPYMYENGIERPGEAACKWRGVTISGCRDAQTSADAYDSTRKPAGALTSTILEVLKSGERDVLRVVEATNAIMRQKGFDQVSQVGSSRSLKNVPFTI